MLPIHEHGIFLYLLVSSLIQTLFFWAPKSLRMVIAAMKLKDTYNGLKTISLTSGAGKSGQPLVKE